MFFFKKRKKVQTQPQQPPSEPQPEPLCVTTVLTPEKTSILDIANLQGIGQREQQQDAFGISPADRYETDGILAVLCDGMGGMAEGQRIAVQTVSSLLNAFPFPEPQTKSVPELISACTQNIYQQFYGHGGCTLVAAWLFENRLHFWSVGDSDLFLLRSHQLYTLNTRQEFQKDLLLRSFHGTFPIGEAFTDPQAGALSQYIGKEDITPDCTRIPFLLFPDDTLLLCSDGISDTLTLKQIREAMEAPVSDCCTMLETAVRLAALPNQDNYTAIALHYYGKKENTE